MSKKDRKRSETTRRQKEQRQVKAAAAGEDAAEGVGETDGRWYVSHCGWAQGGVYLAPLLWDDGLDNADASLKRRRALTSITPPGRGV